MMPQLTWDNVACTFQTLNTENAYGNSEYTITNNPNRMVRFAPVNKKRAASQVNFDVQKSLCYLQPASFSYTGIMQEPNDANITIFDVFGDHIVFRIPGRHLWASRTPATGWYVFDCVNNGGVLSDIHVGHSVINLQFI
ncbi:MAG: hypothetical protein K2X74_00970 [Acetobacteraceae bacterium]|nr:hypothetical protein [Acetobacteraceae bacterium]